MYFVLLPLHRHQLHLHRDYLLDQRHHHLHKLLKNLNKLMLFHYHRFHLK